MTESRKEPTNTGQTFNDLAREVNAISTAHGFWPQDKDDALAALEKLMWVREHDKELETIKRYIMAQEVRNMGEMLMLSVSELAEGLEADREGQPAFWWRHEEACYQANSRLPLDRREAIPFCVCVGMQKPEGLAVELVDAIIRELDTLFSLDVDIDAILWYKMEYNRQRAHKHGKAY